MQIKCSHCGKILTVPDGSQVAQGKCPHCNETIDLTKAERVGLNPGDVLDDFRVDALIGKGGMATVYRGTQVSLDRPVAIKLLAPHLARRPGSSSASSARPSFSPSFPTTTSSAC